MNESEQKMKISVLQDLIKMLDGKDVERLKGKVKKPDLEVTAIKLPDEVEMDDESPDEEETSTPTPKDLKALTNAIEPEKVETEDEEDCDDGSDLMRRLKELRAKKSKGV